MNKKIQLTARLIFGLGFLVFGLNGFFQFIPDPPVSAEAGALLGAFAKTGYFFPMIKLIETMTGLLILSNFFAPLAVVIITPILVGITTIHLFLNPAGLPIIILLDILHGTLAYSYRGHYKGLFIRKPIAL